MFLGKELQESLSLMREVRDLLKQILAEVKRPELKLKPTGKKRADP